VTWSRDDTQPAVHHIHIFGASGSGTTTLGRHLAQRIRGKHLDTDDYYWLTTDPPFTDKRERAERVAMIQQDVEGVENWVLSGSICSWGDALLESFTAAVFLYLAPAIRMARISERERLRYGGRILPGGDMRDQHLEFMDWARSYDHAREPIRSLHLHERWMSRLKCPIIRVDAGRGVDQLCDEVCRAIA
jgi:adenylate kinase family enzyme